MLHMVSRPVWIELSSPRMYSGDRSGSNYLDYIIRSPRRNYGSRLPYEQETKTTLKREATNCFWREHLESGTPNGTRPQTVGSQRRRRDLLPTALYFGKSEDTLPTETAERSRRFVNLFTFVTLVLKTTSTTKHIHYVGYSARSLCCLVQV